MDYVKIRSEHGDPGGMVIWTQKVGGDSADVNVDGSVMVKHGKGYAGTAGYADTFQVYALAGSSGTIIGSNDYSGYESTTPYAPGPSETGKGFIRFELGPIWPRSEVGRFNNSGDFMLGGFVIHKLGRDGVTPARTFVQSGTTVTQVTGNDIFSAVDAGRFLLWDGGGADGTCDRIVSVVDSVTVMVESDRTIETARSASVVSPRLRFDKSGQSLTTSSGGFTINAPIPVSIGVTNPLAIGKPNQATDLWADLHITTQDDRDKGIVIRPHAATQTANLFETQYADTTYSFAVDKEGRPKWSPYNVQNTVGAAGGAEAPPATPQRWLRVLDSDGTILVIPAYPA